MARSKKIRLSHPDGQQPIAKPGTGHQRSGRLLNDRCTQFDNSPFQSDKIHFKECIEAFPASSSSPYDGKKAVIERPITIIHPSQKSKPRLISRVSELQTQFHQEAGNITTRSDDLDSIESNQVTPSYRNITGEVRIEDQWVPLVTDAHPQTASWNVDPTKIAYAVTFLFILLLALGITMCKCWHDKRKSKKQKVMNATTEEWAMVPVTGGRTSPDARQKFFLDVARENAKKEAEERKANRLIFVQHNCREGS